MNNPTVEIGTQLALTLASLYIPGAGPAVTGLSALFDAVKAYNSTRGRPADYVPTREELDAFILEREGKRIPEPGM